MDIFEVNSSVCRTLAAFPADPGSPVRLVGEVEASTHCLGLDSDTACGGVGEESTYCFPLETRYRQTIPSADAAIE